MQRQTLHNLSGLSAGEATKRLLDSLELEGEVPESNVPE